MERASREKARRFWSKALTRASSMNPSWIAWAIAVLTLRWRPDRVSGIPLARESLPFAAERPTARFQEKLNP